VRSIISAGRTAVTLTFALNGVVVSAWVARIPQIKDELGLSDASLGVALLGGPVGLLLAVRFAGRIIGRWGSRAVTRTAGLLAALTLLPLGLAWNLGSLMVALAFSGACIGIMDVAMNAQGVAVERAYGRPLMSGMHGAYSVGTLGGALVGAGAAQWEVPVPVHLGIAAAVLALLLLAGTRGLLDRSADAPVSSDDSAGDSAVPVRVSLLTPILLGVVGFCAFVGEGAMADWTAVYLRESLGTGPGVAGLGYVGCAVAMTLGRFAGDRVVGRFGPVLVLRVGSVIAAAGLGLGLLGGAPVPAVLGFTLFGLGVAVVAPVTFSAAGNLPGVPAATGISWATSIGYSGFLAGPPIIGFVAEGVGLAWALAIPAGLAALITALAPLARTAAN
jgi:MFS family permease